jgi:hypothetical protein
VNGRAVFELLAAAFLLAALVLVIRRSRATAGGWDEAITEHVEATGDFPTVAEWRAGRLARPPADPPPHARPGGPAVVTVTVVGAPRAQLPRGER